MVLQLEKGGADEAWWVPEGVWGGEQWRLEGVQSWALTGQHEGGLEHHHPHHRPSPVSISIVFCLLFNTQDHDFNYVVLCFYVYLLFLSICMLLVLLSLTQVHQLSVIYLLVYRILTLHMWFFVSISSLFFSICILLLLWPLPQLHQFCVVYHLIHRILALLLLFCLFFYIYLVSFSMYVFAAITSSSCISTLLFILYAGPGLYLCVFFCMCSCIVLLHWCKIISMLIKERKI